MKSKILGIFAIAIALSASAFTVKTNKPLHKNTSYAWFKVSSGIAVGSATPKADAMYVDDSSTPPTESGCTANLSNQCISGFDDSQVNPTTHQLINDSQVAQTTPYTRNN